MFCKVRHSSGRGRTMIYCYLLFKCRICFSSVKSFFKKKDNVILETEQVSSEDDDDDDEVDIPSDDDNADDDDLDSSSGSEEIPEAGEQVQQLTIQEEDGEELESEQAQDPDRIKTHEQVKMNESPVIFLASCNLPRGDPRNLCAKTRIRLVTKSDLCGSVYYH